MLQKYSLWVIESSPQLNLIRDFITAGVLSIKQMSIVYQGNQYGVLPIIQAICNLHQIHHTTSISANLVLSGNAINTEYALSSVYLKLNYAIVALNNTRIYLHVQISSESERFRCKSRKSNKRQDTCDVIY